MTSLDTKHLSTEYSFSKEITLPEVKRIYLLGKSFRCSEQIDIPRLVDIFLQYRTRPNRPLGVDVRYESYDYISDNFKEDDYHFEMIARKFTIEGVQDEIHCELYVIITEPSAAALYRLLT